MWSHRHTRVRPILLTLNWSRILSTHDQVVWNQDCTDTHNCHTDNHNFLAQLQKWIQWKNTSFTYFYLGCSPWKWLVSQFSWWDSVFSASFLLSWTNLLGYVGLGHLHHGSRELDTLVIQLHGTSWVPSEGEQKRGAVLMIKELHDCVAVPG